MAHMDKLRVDKWLWAARFYKTRSLACDEIDKGRVEVNGVTVKPARELRVGDSVRVRMRSVTRAFIVQAISDRRGSATQAALMYAETAESIIQRQQAAEQRRLAPEPALSLTHGRPTKRERRDREKLHSKAWNARWTASIGD